MAKGHCLIITKKFEEQNDDLTKKDLRIWLKCVWELKGIGFMNQGPMSSSS